MSRRLEPQDLYAIKLVEDPQIAPDGKRIAYVTAEIDRQTYDYHRTIWVAPADGTPAVEESEFWSTVVARRVQA